MTATQRRTLARNCKANIRAALDRRSAPTCRWFARCGRPATGTTPHPILGQVPTCARCDAFAKS